MKTIKRLSIFGHDLYFRIGKRVEIEGINSTLSDGDSVLFWEFDEMRVSDVRRHLRAVQGKYMLPTIRLYQASTNRSWHAVCLYRTKWLAALSIVAGTPGVDADYIRLAANRERFTLRMTDKGRGAPVLVDFLESYQPESATYKEFLSAVVYGAWVKE